MQDKLNGFTNETACPKCGGKILSKVKFTWWGGMLGPKLFHHTKCESCNYRFNSITGKSNTTAIILYSVVLFVLAFALFYYIRNM